MWSVRCTNYNQIAVVLVLVFLPITQQEELMRYFNQGLEGGSWSCIPAPFSWESRIPHFFHRYPEFHFFFLKNAWKKTNFCKSWPFRLIFAAITFIWVVTISRIPDRQATNPASRPKILANPASLVAVKSRIPSRYFSFSRNPHRILVKSRIPRIPFQTLFNGHPWWAARTRIRVIGVNFSQGKWNLVQVSREFELSEFELTE